MEDDYQIISEGVVDDNGLCVAAIGYLERNDFFRIRDVGSLRKGYGRKLIAKVAKMAQDAGKFVILNCDEGEKLHSYYEDLGFDNSFSSWQFLLKGEALEKLAEEEEVRRDAFHLLSTNMVKMAMARGAKSGYELVSTGKIGPDGIYYVALAYQQRENALHVTDLGSVKKGEGRKLLVEVASRAIDQGLGCVTLNPGEEKELMCYYEGLGFEWLNEYKRFALHGDALRKLAQEA